MNIPETIYLAVIENVTGTTYVPAIKSSDPISIPYHREKECVWKAKEGLAWNPHRVDGEELIVCMYPTDRDANPFCPNCGGTIRVEEDT